MCLKYVKKEMKASAGHLRSNVKGSIDHEKIGRCPCRNPWVTLSANNDPRTIDKPLVVPTNLSI